MKSHGFHWVPGSAGWPHLLGCRSLPAGTGRRRTATFQALSTAGFPPWGQRGGLTRKNMVIWHLSHEKTLGSTEIRNSWTRIGISPAKNKRFIDKHVILSARTLLQPEKNTWFNQQSCKRMCLTRRTQTEMGSYSLNWWSIKKVLK